MRVATFVLSAVCAVSGIASGIVGIFDESIKALALGLLLLAGGSVFAMLYLGSRSRAS